MFIFNNYVVKRVSTSMVLKFLQFATPLPCRWQVHFVKTDNFKEYLQVNFLDFFLSQKGIQITSGVMFFCDITL